MAKKKQLNRRVVVLLICLGAVLLLGIAAAVIYMRPGDPAQYAKRAEQALANKKYSEANELYGKAISLDKRNAQYFIAYGNLKEEWRNNDRTLTQAAWQRLFMDAFSCYREAARYAPENVEAWRKQIKMQEIILSSGGGNDDRLKEYVNQLDSVIKLDPKDLELVLKRAQARALLAVAHTEMAAQAEADYRSLVEKNPQEEMYWINLARFFSGRRQLDEADKVYQEAIKANPKSGRILVSYSGFLMGQEARRKDSLKVAQDAITAQPDYVDGYLQLAICYQNDKNMDKALEIFNQALGKDPNKAMAYLSMSTIYAIQKQPGKAEAILTKGVEQLRQSVKDSKAKEQDLNMYRQGILLLDYNLADAMMDRVRDGTVAKDVAKPKLEETLKEMQGINARSLLVDAVNGRLLLLDDNPKDAEAILVKVYEASRDPKVAQLLIDAYTKLNQPGDAQKVYETYLKSTEQTAPNMLSLAKMYCDYRQYDQAERTVKEAARLDPANEDVKVLAAAIAVARGQENRIPRNLKEIDPFTMGVFTARARALWTEGEQDQAIALMGDVHERFPQSLEVTGQLVTWLRQRNDAAKADEVAKQTREALAAKPEMLRQLDMIMETDPAKQMEIVLKEIDQRFKDPSDRALARFDVLMESKQEDKALAELKPVQDKDPNNPALIEKLFNYHVSKSEWDKAKQYADQAAKLDIDKAGGKLYLAILDMSQDKLDQAITTLNEVVRDRPKFHMAHALLGECYLRQQNMDKAHDEFLLAYEQNPKNVKALLGLMQVAEATGKTTEYEQYLTLAYKFMPSYPPVREKYLELQEAKQDPEKLIKQREQMLKGQNDKEPLNLMNAARLAMLYEKAKQPNKADKIYRMMDQAAPNSPMVVRLLVDFLRRTDRDVEARDVLAKFAERSTDKTVAYLLWAEHLEKSGQNDQAKGMFAKAMQADTDGSAYGVYAAFCERHGDYAEAAKALQDVAKRAKADADRAAAERRMAFDLIYAGSFDSAQEMITRMLQANRSDADALALQGILYMRKPGLEKGMEKARESLDGALAIDNQHLIALTHRAELLLMIGEGALAAQDLESARRAKGASNEDLSLKLATIYDSIGDSASADSVLQTLLNDQPSNLGALRLRAQLATKNQAWPRLEQALAAAQAQFPKEPAFQIMEAQMWRSRGQNEKAMDAISRAAQSTTTTEDRNELSLQAIQLMLDTGQYDQAMKTAAPLAGDKKVGSRAVAMAARAKAKKGDAAGAQADFEAAIRSASAGEVAFVMAQVAGAYPPAQAVTMLTKWTGLRPDNSGLFYQLSVFQLTAGDGPGSLESAKQALAKAATPNDKLIALTQEALAAEAMKQYDLAVLCFQEGLKEVPGDVPTLNNVAYMLSAHLNRHAEALPFAEKAAHRMPSNAGILDTYGMVLLNMGKLDEAANVLKRGLDLQPMASSRLFLGDVYDKQGQKDKALEQYKLGLQMVQQTPKDPNYKPLADAVKRVGGTP